MKKYILLDTLITEIEKRRDKNARNKLNLAAAFEDNYLLSFLDTLEIKGVNLEKEVANWWKDHYKNIKNDYRFEGYNGHYMENSTIISLAQYFFELGLKAKGE